MSVPEGAREDNRFTLPVRAEELANHTLKVTRNEKIFLPEYQRVLTDKLIDAALETYLLIREANDIHVKENDIVNFDALAKRNALQEKALDHIKRMLPLIDLARRVFHLSTRKVKFWSKMVIEVRDRTKGWMEDDMRRYSRK